MIENVNNNNSRRNVVDIELLSKYNIEAIINYLRDAKYISEDDANDVFDIILRKINRLVYECKVGLNSVACLKLDNYVRELKKIMDGSGLGNAFVNRIDSYIMCKYSDVNPSMGIERNI